jgi:hypothetical protein
MSPVINTKKEKMQATSDPEYSFDFPLKRILTFPNISLLLFDVFILNKGRHGLI